MTPSRQAAPASPPGGIVLVKGIAGLGNRILALLGAAMYARLSGRRLVVDWRDGLYAGEGVNAFPEMFRARSAGAWSPPATDSVAPWMWRGRLDETARTLHLDHVGAAMGFGPLSGRMFSVDMRTLHHPEEVVVVWSLVSFVGELRRHLEGPWEPWRRLDDRAIEARILREEFEFQPAITERIGAIRRTWGATPTVGVHVRHTDRRTVLPRLTRRLDALLARRPGARVFLATDDPAVQAHFTRRYPGLLSVPKWFPAGGAIHVRDSGCADRSSMAREALVEMGLLAECDDVVLDGDSTFSQIVARLWRGDPRRIVDTKPLGWLPEGTRNRLWRTREWLRWGRTLRSLGMPLRPPRPVGPSSSGRA